MKRSDKNAEFWLVLQVVGNKLFFHLAVCKTCIIGALSSHPLTS